jgi:hypothetical protein
MKRRFFLSFLLIATLRPAIAQTTPTVKTPLELITAYNQALLQCNAEALDRLFALDYIEVSPLGEVDDRKKVIQVYKDIKEQPKGLTQLLFEEPVIRTYGQLAVVIGRESFVLEGGARRSLRTTFVCRLQNKQWQLVSAHFTGIRPPALPKSQ